MHNAFICAFKMKTCQYYIGHMLILKSCSYKYLLSYNLQCVDTHASRYFKAFFSYDILRYKCQCMKFKIF